MQTYDPYTTFIEDSITYTLGMAKQAYIGYNDQEKEACFMRLYDCLARMV